MTKGLGNWVTVLFFKQKVTRFAPETFHIGIFPAYGLGCGKPIEVSARAFKWKNEQEKPGPSTRPRASRLIPAIISRHGRHCVRMTRNLFPAAVTVSNSR
jgi:hypothetical protein